ncbi:unnamed protein product, partial [Rotaria sp. Silwood2]
SNASSSQAGGTRHIQDIDASDLTNFFSGRRLAASDDTPSSNRPSSSSLDPEVLYNTAHQHPTS